MDIVVRTPHGDADISIVGHGATTTLGDVIGAVTGQAAPRLALIDGRSVACSCRLDESGLLVGSTVTTEPALPVPTPPEAVDIVQITGHGAGRVARLGAGRYRMGPGRRSTAPELDLAPVDQPSLDLVIESTANATEITVVPIEPGVALDGEHISDAATWKGEILTVGARAFRVQTARSAGRPDAERAGSGIEGRGAAPRGTVEFNRPPRRRNAPRRLPVVDALHDATTGSPCLWERRPNHADAFSLPFGLSAVGGADDPNTTAAVDLAVETGVAIVGSERYRMSLVRTLVIEAATLHGPADLDLVVLTSPERSGDWDWAKWLPHLRLEGRPAILSSEHDIERWVDHVDGEAPRPPMRWSAPHLTLAVVDDPALWRRHRSPLRPLLSRTPTDVKVIALCDEPSHAPAICSAMISETDAGHATFRSFDRGADIEDVRPSLTETAVAVHIARALAPLIDVELPPSPAAPPTPPFHLGELIPIGGADEVLVRWSGSPPRPTVTIGRRGDSSVDIAAAGDVTVVVGTSMNDAFTVGASSLFQQCGDAPPEALWILPLIVTDLGRSTLLWGLPHATEPHDPATPIEPRRLLARIRAVLADDDGPERVLVIVEDSRLSPASPDEELLGALVDGAHTTHGLSVLVVTDRWDRDPPITNVSTADTVIRVHRGQDAGRGRTATVTTAGDRSGEAFVPPAPSDATSLGLEILPLVIGRPPTPLERRLEQEQARAGDAPDPVLRAIVDDVRRAARSWASDDAGPRVLVPPPLPSHIDVDELFRSSPGDGVPLGLGDDPASGELRPRWWRPGQGSLLAFGSRRSGIEQVPTVITLGILDRFAPDDVRLVLIEPSVSRRRALGSVDNAPIVRAADRPGDIVETLDEIEAEIDRLAGAGSARASVLPQLVVVVPDLARLRRQLTDDALATRLDAVLARAAEFDSGVDVVAYAADLAGAGPFAASVSQRLIGASSDRSDLAALGLDHSSDLEGVAGRCRWFPGGDLVQLGLPDDDLETLLARRSAGGRA